MKSIVIYDSNFGNTKLVAEAIAKALSAKTAFVDDMSFSKIEDYDLVVVGSPIIGWKPSEKMGIFLANINDGQLSNVRVATFDTRVKLFIHGDAMAKIAKLLEEAGGKIVVESMPFYVKGQNGPLLEGEIDKAKSWAKEILNKVSKG